MASSNSRLLASDVNSLFQQLENLRQAHYAGEANANLATAFDSSPIDQNTIVEEYTTLMKQYINTLRKSVFLTGITEAQVNSIITPDPGDLIKFSTYQQSENLITEIASKPSSFASNFNHNGVNFSCKNNFGSDFTNFSFDGSDFSCFINFGTNFSCFNNFGSDFTNYSFSTDPTTPHTNQRFDGRFFQN